MLKVQTRTKKDMLNFTQSFQYTNKPLTKLKLMMMTMITKCSYRMTKVLILKSTISHSFQILSSNRLPKSWFWYKTSRSFQRYKIMIKKSKINKPVNMSIQKIKKNLKKIIFILCVKGNRFGGVHGATSMLLRNGRLRFQSKLIFQLMNQMKNWMNL